MADNTTELEVLDEIVDVLGGLSGQHETVVPTLQQIRDLLGGGGGGGGYNPALSVGRADALTGADSTAQWATRESTGSGAATVRSVQGASVVWNQLCRNEYPSGDNNGVTFTNNGDGTWTLNGTATERGNKAISTIVLTQGHKYLVKGAPSGGSASTYFLGIAGFDTDTGAGGIWTDNTTYATLGARIDYFEGVTFDNAVFVPQVFDLTAMFGSGNEPATVAEFEAMYPEPYYPYSAPILKPVRIAGIRSTDAQGGELDAIEWTAQTLRSAGSVADMLYADHVDVKVGVVDLGELTWTKTASDKVDAGYYFAALIDDSAIASVNKQCSKYTPIYDTRGLTAITNTYGSSVDKISFGTSNSKNVFIIDSTYTDSTTAEFKTAMSGVLLFYELETPTTTPISPALPMTYRVQQGGSESIIVPNGEISAPPVLTIAEGESAGELVMDALACIAAPDGPTATSNHAVGTYLTMQGKLYKVTSAIAVGETIKSGTNVTETTVMAELIARTA